MHDGDLPRWPTEADEAELEPEAKSFGEGGFGDCGVWIDRISHSLAEDRRFCQMVEG